MIIQLKKFGTTLTSRQLGQEALAAFLPTLATVPASEDIHVDFTDVFTFSPSWGDEFLGALQRRYRRRLVLQRTDNPSVDASLRLLEQVHGYKFRYSPHRA